jgi:phosphopantothenoylcysteine decarboxylase / phosphopantothenate---cysteine ligase
MRILLGVSGGIAAYKAPELVRRLRERGAEVRCALTPAAASFVAPLALEVVSGHRVYREEYLESTGRGVEEHIELAAWAELLLLAPATANLLARISLGLADDFLSTSALAYQGSLLVAPAMHTAMWENPATREHVERLRKRGARFVGPVAGPLASGEVGMGRMAEPEEIAEAAWNHRENGSLRGRRVVVTAGPTYEPLDPVRFLGNRSSGKMGFALAAEAAARGARVLLIAGPVSLPTPPGVERVDVETAQQMQQALSGPAAEADLVLMAAAVADFRPREAAAEKLKKKDGVPRLELAINPDILAELSRSPSRGVLVGFAAETAELEARALDKLGLKGVDFLVANDVSRADIAFGSDWNEVTVLRPSAEPVRLPRQPKRQLAGALFDLFEEALPPRD